MTFTKKQELKKIIGNRQLLLKKHWEAWQRWEGNSAFLDKAFSQSERAEVAKIYNRIRKAGFLIVSFDSDEGKPKFAEICRNYFSFGKKAK